MIFIASWSIINYMIIWLSYFKIQILCLTFFSLWKLSFMKRSRLSDLMIDSQLLTIWSLIWRFKSSLFIRLFSNSDFIISYIFRLLLIKIFWTCELTASFWVILKRDFFIVRKIMRNVRNMLLILYLITVRMIYRRFLMIRQVIQLVLAVFTMM